MTWHHMQIEIIAGHHRNTLLREAEMERLASQLNPAKSGDKKSDPRPQRRGLTTLWPRLASQAS